MMLLSDIALQKLTSSMLLNIYTIEPAGFLKGKAGVALALFELSRFCKDESLENHAFNLLQEALAYDVPGYDFVNGTPGIAYVIHYLIKNQFLDADYIDLYEKQHQKIIKNILSAEYKEEKCFRYINNLFFINALSEYIPKNIYQKCQTILYINIKRTLNLFFQKIDLKTGMYFHRYAIKLMTACNSLCQTDINIDKFISTIKKIQNKLDKLDYVNTPPLFPIQLYICETLREKKIIQRENVKLIDTCMQNTIISSLNFRQKTDLIFYIYKIFHINHALDYRTIANSIVETLRDKNIDKFEKKIYNNIFKNSPYEISIEMGISRLILLNIYWEQIQMGVFSDNIVQLLN